VNTLHKGDDDDDDDIGNTFPSQRDPTFTRKTWGSHKKISVIHDFAY
jgi:hypothetical protein